MKNASDGCIVTIVGFIVVTIFVINEIITFIKDHWFYFVGALIILLGIFVFIGYLSKRNKSDAEGINDDNSSRENKNIEKDKDESKKQITESNIQQVNEYKKQVEEELAKIGATFVVRDYHVTIQANNSVDVDKLLSYTDKIDHKLLGIEWSSGLVDFVICNEQNRNLMCVKFERTYSSRSNYRYTCFVAFSDASSAQKIFKGVELDDCIESCLPFIKCHLRNISLQIEHSRWLNIITDGLIRVKRLNSKHDNVEDRVIDIMSKSYYYNLFEKEFEAVFNNGMLIVNYLLPTIDGFLDVKEYKYVAKTNSISETVYPKNYVTSTYENVIYSICLRTLYELFVTDMKQEVQNITFNGYVNAMNKAIGRIENKCIVSLQASRQQIENINLSNIEPKICFKSLKGVSAAKLADISPVLPILQFDKTDKRFTETRNVDINQGENLASMDWQDFEQLVRNIFELEFSINGGDVKITQASRDGGVDAVVFDPDPIRGGKIIIQAKRYTNTVGVSAVRDLYGTVINEGANSGILITTSDYGSDSYEFAKNKPIKLLNGQHLLGLLQKHGKSARINIKEAKEYLKQA